LCARGDQSFDGRTYVPLDRLERGEVCCVVGADQDQREVGLQIFGRARLTGQIRRAST
jgi:hypothetical protein